MSIWLLLAIFASVGGALLIVCMGERWANLREFWFVVVGVVMFALVVSMILDVLVGDTFSCVFFRIFFGIELVF